MSPLADCTTEAHAFNFVPVMTALQSSRTDTCLPVISFRLHCLSILFFSFTCLSRASFRMLGVALTSYVTSPQRSMHFSPPPWGRSLKQLTVPYVLVLAALCSNCVIAVIIRSLRVCVQVVSLTSETSPVCSNHTGSRGSAHLQLKVAS